MALTFTRAGLQAALTAVNDAAAGDAKRVAWEAYVLTYGGYVKKAGMEGASVDLPSPDDLLEGLIASGSLRPGRAKRRGRFRSSFA